MQLRPPGVLAIAERPLGTAEVGIGAEAGVEAEARRKQERKQQRKREREQRREQESAAAAGAIWPANCATRRFARSAIIRSGKKRGQAARRGGEGIRSGCGE